MIAASESLPLSLGQLARLVSVLALPDPEGDGGGVHGPGGPRLRDGTTNLRDAAIVVIRWAQALAEQATIIDLMNGGPTMKQTASQSNPEPTPPQDPKKGTGDGGGSQDGATPKEPPTSVMKFIEPQIDDFVCSLSEADAVKLPSPDSGGPDPWRVPITDERDRVFGLLQAGAQFELAAEASSLERLRDLFRQTAQNLFRRSLHHPAIAIM